MELREVYKNTLKSLKQHKKQGNITEFREEQLYFTALVMGIVARKDDNYEAFKKAEFQEQHPEKYKQGIVDSANINMTESILFEAMSYNDEITRMLPIDKKENQ